MEDHRIEQIVEGYIRRNLSPTHAERKDISDKYKELESYLDERTFQSGSYARHTSTTRVNDLDVIYELPERVYKTLAEERIDPNELDMSDILGTLAKALSGKYGKAAVVKAQLHSVAIFFGSEDDFSIDVVPAIPADDSMFWVPEAAHLSIARRRKFYQSSPQLTWIKSDPKGYIKQAEVIDAKSDGNFRKAAKFVKKWRAGCKGEYEGLALKSFHLELLVTEYFKTNPLSSIWRSIEQFFAELGNHIVEPQLADRADSSCFIDEYLRELSQAERQCIRDAQLEALETIGQVNSAETQAEVLKGIESLLKLGYTQIGAPIVGATRSNPAVSRPWCSDEGDR